MSTPEWDEQNKHGSLERWIDVLNEEARRQFLSMGTHLEIFFIFGDDGLREMVPIVGMDKDAVVRELKKRLVEHDGYAFIHIVEAKAQQIDYSAEADMLLVFAESRDGLSVACCSTVVMRGEDKLLLDTVKVDGSHISGHYVGLFDGLDPR